MFSVFRLRLFAYRGQVAAALLREFVADFVADRQAERFQFADVRLEVEPSPSRVWARGCARGLAAALRSIAARRASTAPRGERWSIFASRFASSSRSSAARCCGRWRHVAEEAELRRDRAACRRSTCVFVCSPANSRISAMLLQPVRRTSRREIMAAGMTCTSSIAMRAERRAVGLAGFHLRRAPEAERDGDLAVGDALAILSPERQHADAPPVGRSTAGWPAAPELRLFGGLGETRALDAEQAELVARRDHVVEELRGHAR